MKVKITTDMNKINDEAFENVYGGSIRRTARNNTEELEEAAARNQRS